MAILSGIISASGSKGGFIPFVDVPPVTTGMVYRFAANHEVYSDVGMTTLAIEDDPVAAWGNLGTAEDAVQNTLARRPIYKTGGLNGYPYLQCTQADDQYFEDLLALSQPSGFGSGDFNPFSVCIVTDELVVPSSGVVGVLGTPFTVGGKMALYFRFSDVGGQIHSVKSGHRNGAYESPQILCVANVTSNNYRQLKNGVLFVSTNATTMNSSDAVTATQFLRATGAGTPSSFNGRVYEVLIYDRGLSDAELGQVSEFFREKYAIFDPAPAVPTGDLLFHFSADVGVYSDVAGTTPATDTDTVGLWANQGSSHDAVQNTAARRPVYRTGGLNSMPYIACDRTVQQFFEDLAFTQPSGTGISDLRQWSCFAVVDNVSSLANFPSLTGSTLSAGGKLGFYFRSALGEQHHILKAGNRFGTYANPTTIGFRAVSRDDVRGHINRHIFQRTNTGAWSSSTAISATQFLRSTGLGGSDGFFQGRIYEFLLYDRVLTNEEMLSLELYLRAKYGL